MSINPGGNPKNIGRVYPLYIWTSCTIRKQPSLQGRNIFTVANDNLTFDAGTITVAENQILSTARARVVITRHDPHSAPGVVINVYCVQFYNSSSL